MTVIAYLKAQCGWSRGVREVLARCGIEYEEKQIHIPDNFIEMVEKTGQHMQPCVQFDDTMLVDVSGEEVLEYLVSSGNGSVVNTDVPLDAPCTDEEHEQQRLEQFYNIEFK
tara:strand:- start:476 stop:811 length:336 start_codon:yes stop_codon:yes gene_type:complete